MTRAEFRARWVERRAVLEECGDGRAIKLIDRLLLEFDDYVQTDAREPIDLTAASALCGFSRRHLGRLVKDGIIPNRGRPGAPKVNPADLPIKSAALRALPEDRNLEAARDRIALSVVRSNDG